MANVEFRDADKDKECSLTLFGGDKGWDADDWTDSDDRVRGGISQSYLDICEKNASFNGTLDIKTLGGAGFASQRTTGEDRTWDLSDYAGLKLHIAKGDKRRYTLILKDTILEKDPDTGREQSTISWECDFELPPQTEPGHVEDKTVFIPWAALNPTYRGKVKKDVEPLDLSGVKRFSFMMRSFFGTQEGDFELVIKKVTAEKKAPCHGGGDEDSAIILAEGEWVQAVNESWDVEKQAGPRGIDWTRRFVFTVILGGFFVSGYFMYKAFVIAHQIGWI